MAKKVRLHQLAKELNIGSDALISFLKGKKYKVSSIMSPIDEKMYEDIMKEFEAEKVQADRKRTVKRKKMEGQEGTVVEEVHIRDINIEVSGTEDLSDISIEVQIISFEEKMKIEAAEAEKIAEEAEVIEEPIEVEEAEIEEQPEPVDKAIEQKEVEPEKAEEEVIEEEVVPEEVDEFMKEVKEVLDKKKEAEEAEVKEEAGEEIDKEKKEYNEIAQKLEKQKLKDKVRKLSEKGRDIAEKARKKKEEVEDIDEKRKKAKKKKKKRKRVDIKEVEATLKDTLAKMDEGRALKKYKKKQKIEEEITEEDNIIKVTEFISTGELADLMDVNVSDVIAKCMELGLMVSINQRLDFETITMVADEFDYNVELATEFEETVEEEEEVEDEKDLTPRPPIVTVMGHVDHGKTTLLDYIRKANVVDKEAGGITQHIGAYAIDFGGKQITFLDTPGHEAFTAMRARGAQLTDIVVLIVAADDNVMPQTIEAIDHAKAAQVPIIIAINKVDKPNADPDRIRKQLGDYNILVDSWGGKYSSVEVSAKSGKGINDLLEVILIEAEELNLKANAKRLARGIILESKLDKGRGPVATVLIQKGTLNIQDSFVSGFNSGKVRAMFNENGDPEKLARPADPVQVVGFDGLPQAGDTFIVMETDREARDLASKRQILKREQDHRRVRHTTLDEIARQIQHGKLQELPLIIKADVDGSVEAISDALMKLATEEVAVNIIRKGVGAISESDVLLASASNAFIMGFNVRPTSKARDVAEKEEIEITLYDVIYDAINDVKAALEGLLSPKVTENVVGLVEVKDTFKVPKIGTIAGCFVKEGRIAIADRIRIVREHKVLFDGKISSLKRFKDDAKEVKQGFECGVGIENYNDIKVGDEFECYEVIEEKRTLDK